MDVQITVASKVPGIPGKPTSKIIDTTGKTWLVYNDKFGQFQEGNSYVITKHKVNEFKGATYYMVEAFTPVAGGGSARGGEMLRGQTNGGAASPPMYSKNPDNTKIDEQRRMDIFICGAFNNMMANPNVHPLDLSIAEKAAQVNELRQIWLTTLGPNRPSQISTSAARMENAPPPVRDPDDMSDSIPF